ncbi:MAG TPA: TlpA disulfide reductase family protein [Solirubrobacterales bacterium]|jgi:cytochrome c biogenesis protein CcmG/thiol:disulfide interchange protein DsbE
MSAKGFAAFMGVLAVVALLAFGVIAKGEGRVQPGDEAPVESLPVLGEEGEFASLADYRGQWVLANVWASWCNPCRDEAPTLERFQRRHGGENFTVLGIDSRDASDEALEFVEEFELSYPSIRDGSGDYAEAFGATGVPESFLIDPDGKVAAVWAGPVTEEDLQQQVLPLISEAS